MNDDKLQKLFRSARNEPAPAGPENFDQRVVRAIRRDMPPAPATLFDQLGALFPRLALASLLVIGLCVALDFSLSALGQSDLESGIAQLSDQWLFPVKGF